MNIRTILIQTLLTLSLLTWLVGVAQAQNTVFGTGAGDSLTTGTGNTLIGENAGFSITDGADNTLVGNQAGLNTAGSFNTMVGDTAGVNTTTGFENAFFGDQAGHGNTTGSTNTYLGRSAGQNSLTGSGNVFVGFSAGASEFGSDKLYIANTGTAAPLIYGEFDNALVGINGALGVGTQMPMDQLHVKNGNLRIEQTGAAFATLNFTANGNTWEILNNPNTGRLVFFSPGKDASTGSFKFDPKATENLLRVGVAGPSTVDINGKLKVNGDLEVTGTISPDYVFTPEYTLESIDAHAAYMWQHRHLPAVGPGQVNAGGQGVINVGRRSQGMLEELEKAHIYIEQLHGEITQNEDQLEALKGDVAVLKALMHQLMIQDWASVPREKG